MILVLLTMFAGPAVAQDMGEQVRFSGRRISSRSVLPRGLRGRILFSGTSDAPRVSYDALLIHGQLPEKGVRLEASRETSGGWTAWRPLRLKRFANGRFWARADFHTAQAGRLRLRGVDSGVRAAHVIVLYSAEVFLSGAAQPGGNGSPVVPGPSRPPVIERDQWQAQAPKSPYENHAPNRISQHHTAGPQTASLAESLQEVRFIQNLHQQGRGWSDIGYHYLIDSVGRMFVGRPEGVQGAHVRGLNSGNVGVSLMGYHHAPHDDPVSAAQMESIKRIVGYLAQQYSIAPQLYRGHRDQRPTACPGDIMYGRLEEVRQSMMVPPPVPAPLRAGLIQWAESL
jgi:hypothetical protein